MDIIAHRGASALAPENTSAAFRKALHLGVDGIELDVQLSKDGIPVVIHDPTLLRTANTQLPVSSLTARELGKIDVGSWFSPTFNKEGILTLHQALDLINLSAKVYIEVKGTPANRQTLTHEVIQIIDKRNIHNAVEVISFSPETLSQAAKERKKKVALRLLTIVGSIVTLPWVPVFREYIDAVNVDFYDPLFITLVTRKGKTISLGAMPQVMPATMEKLTRQGFSAIMRNDPTLFV